MLFWIFKKSSVIRLLLFFISLHCIASSAPCRNQNLKKPFKVAVLLLKVYMVRCIVARLLSTNQQTPATSSTWHPKLLLLLLSCLPSFARCDTCTQVFYDPERTQPSWVTSNPLCTAVWLPKVHVERCPLTGPEMTWPFHCPHCNVWSLHWEDVCVQECYHVEMLEQSTADVESARFQSKDSDSTFQHLGIMWNEFTSWEALYSVYWASYKNQVITPPG